LEQGAQNKVNYPPQIEYVDNFHEEVHLINKIPWEEKIIVDALKQDIHESEILNRNLKE